MPKRGNKKTKKPSRPNTRLALVEGATMNATLTHIMPRLKVATLSYCDLSTIRNNPGNSFICWSMRAGDLFDPDPLLLSGSVSNFKEMMQFYSYYRVLQSFYTWSICNLETFPLAYGIVYSQTNLSTVLSTAADCQNAFENDFATPVRVISGKGGMDRALLRSKCFPLSNLLGSSKQYLADIGYVGQGVASPPIQLFVNFIVWSPTGATLSNGYANITTLYFRTQFFGRTNVRA